MSPLAKPVHALPSAPTAPMALVEPNPIHLEPMSAPTTHVTPAQTQTSPASVPTLNQSEGTFARFSWIPVIERFCWCCSLKTCCIVQGWFMMVLSLSMITFLGREMMNGCAGYGCYDYVLFEYLVFILSDGIVQLFVAGLFVLGVNQVHAGLLLPYCIFLHLRIITDIHHIIYWSSIRGHHPAALTVFLILIPMSVAFAFLTSANSLRVKIAEKTCARNTQLA